MKLNNILYSLTKKQIQCLLVVALAEKRCTKPSIADLRNIIAVARGRDANIDIKVPATTQNLQKLGLIKTERIPQYIIESRQGVRGSNPKVTYHLTDKGKTYLTDRVLNRA